MGLVLGGFIFTDYAIPERVPLGGEHEHVIHRLIGGERVIDAMGPNDSDIHWSGRFQGPTALSKALALEAFRLSGAQIPLVIDSQFRMVAVRKFEWEYERWYQIIYKISCVVVDNFGGLPSFGSSLDSVVGADLGVVNNIVNGLANGELSVGVDLGITNVEIGVSL